MSQKLIQPVNGMIVTCSYKNPNYPKLIVNGKPMGVDHWGFDCKGSSTIWSQGIGIVLATGYDTCYGNYVSVMYFDVEEVGNGISNYYHLASIGVSMGQFVNKDIRLGVMGMTGTYATGIHLHTEMRKYVLGQEKMLSPFGTNKFKKDTAAGWIDPLSITYCKTSAPDGQTYSTDKDMYINSADLTAKIIK